MCCVDEYEDELVEAMRGPIPPGSPEIEYTGFVSDGCTRAPEGLIGEDGELIDVSLACLLHDWAYFIGGSECDRRTADHNLMVNMLVLGSTVAAALLYYKGVRLFGAWGKSRGFQYESRGTVLHRMWYSLKALIWD